MLIRLELLAVAPQHERTELIRAFGDPSARWGMDGIARTASVQRGGLDSDPLVRVLARRAWGDRDRQWCADRGVRKDDRIVVIEADGVRKVATAWPGEIFSGFALSDALPGERVRCKMLGPDASLFRVSDRLRVEPLPPPPRVDPVRPKPLGARRLLGMPASRSPSPPETRATPLQYPHSAWIYAALARGAALADVVRELQLTSSLTYDKAADLVHEHLRTRPAVVMPVPLSAEDLGPLASILHDLARESHGIPWADACALVALDPRGVGSVIDHAALLQARQRLGEAQCQAIYTAACDAIAITPTGEH